MATDGKATIVLSASDKTGAAFASARRNILGLQSSAAGINATLGPLLGTVGLLGSALSLVNFKSIVNGIDALNDLKDATGASIENISALEDVAARTGTSFDTVGTALVKFNAQLKEAKPGSGPAEVLKAIGLAAEDLKRLDPAEALRQTAVALAGFADDGNKARITQELFGKSVKEVAPFLNDLAKQGKLNATVTTEQAEAAEKFNQQISALEKNIKDVAREIAGPMVQALNTLFAAIDGGDKEFKELSATTEAFLVPLQALTVLGANVAFVFAGVGREIGAISAQAVALAGGNLAAVVAIRDEVIADGKSARATLDDLEKRVLRIRDGGPTADFSNEGRNRPKPGAPDVPGKADTAGIDKARQEALANLRKVIDGRVKAIAEGLDDERDQLRFHEEFSKALYGQGVQSLEKFYAAQDRARAENLAAVRRATEAEIAERQRLLDSPLLKGKDKAAERQEVQNQIEAARAKLRGAEREADQAAQLAAVDRQRATEALRDDVAALDAQIEQLAGNAAGANLLDIANKVRDARRLLTQGGETPEEVERKLQQLRTLLTVQQQFNTARDNLATISQDAAVAEERLLRSAENSGAGLLQTEQAVGALRTRALGEIEALIARTRELVSLSPGDSELLRFLQDLELQAERTREALDPTKLRLDAAANDIGATLADGFGRALTNVRDIKAILNDVGARVFQIVNDELIVKPLATSLSGMLRGAGGQGTGENILTSIFGIGKGAAAPGAAAAAGLLPGEHDMAAVTRAVLGLGSAATGSADVLGKLPQLAAIPATTAITALGGAAQIATQALLQMSSAAVAGAAGSSGIGSLGLGGLIGGGGGFGTGANFGNLDLGLFLHKGGIAGFDGSTTRYHTGGIAGSLPNLQADEVPAILRRGEEVLTANDPRHRNNAGSSAPAQITQHFHIQGSAASPATMQQLSVKVARAAQSGVARGSAG